MIVGGKNPGIWFGHNAWISAVISVVLWLARGGRNARRASGTGQTTTRPGRSRQYDRLQRRPDALRFTDRVMTNGLKGRH